MNLAPLGIAAVGVGLVTAFYLVTSAHQKSAGQAMGAFDAQDPTRRIAGGATAYNRALASYAHGNHERAKAVLRENYDATTANALWHRLLNEGRRESR